ncbi:MAG: DUF2325 domain-containing protein [Lachnospiraceae bacterium]|nr:DUF2325 domain-containing protein [Lachnospiraceae bacterium]
MFRKELIEKMDDLKECIIMPSNRYELLADCLPQPAENYNAGKDPYIKACFKYLSPASKGFKQYIDCVSLTIALALAKGYMTEPTVGQMLDMLEKSGYTAEEMEKYVADDSIMEEMQMYVTDDTDLKVDEFLATQKSFLPTIFLLSRVISDVLDDKSEWAKYKNGWESKTLTPSSSSSLRRLRELTIYMEQNGLLFLDEDASEKYKEFVIIHSWAYLRSISIKRQEESISIKIAQEMNTRTTRFEKIKKRFEKKEQHRLPDNDFDMSDCIKMKELSNEMDNFEAEMNSLQKEVSDITNYLSEETSERMNQILPEEIDNIIVIAMGAFQAILANDEIFRLAIGQAVLNLFVSISEYTFSLNHAETSDFDNTNDLNDASLSKENKSGITVTYPKDMEAARIHTKEITSKIQMQISEQQEIWAQIEQAWKENQGLQCEHKELMEKINKLNGTEAKTISNIVKNSKKDLTVNADTTKLYKDISEILRNNPALSANSNSGQWASSGEFTEARLQEEDAHKEEMERILKKLKKTNSHLSYDVSKMQDEYRVLKKYIGNTKKEPTLTKEMATTDNAGKAPIQVLDGAVEKTADNTTGISMLFIGGRNSIRGDLKENPDLHLARMSNKPDIKSCRNYDMAVVQTDYLGHSDYHAYKNACKKYGVKLIHSNNNNTERFMDLIRTETEKKG